MYVITDDDVYLNIKGKYRVVENLQDASKFKLNKANNIIKCIPKDLQKYAWKIKYAEQEKGITFDLNSRNDYNLNNEIAKMEDFAEKLKYREEFLIMKLQVLELKIVDLHHYIEIYNLNMYKAWLCYKLFRDVMIERRSVKDEIVKISNIKNSTMKDVAKNKISKSVLKPSERKYTPRILNDLFNDIKKD